MTCEAETTAVEVATQVVDDAEEALAIAVAVLELADEALADCLEGEGGGESAAATEEPDPRRVRKIRRTIRKAIRKYCPDYGKN